MESVKPEDRVSMVQERVFLVRELSNPTPETVSQSANYIRELSRDCDKFSILVEFQSRVFPSAAVRHRVAEEMVSMKGKLAHVAIITNNNVVLSVAIRFIALLSGYRHISFHRSREDALQLVQKRFPSR